MSAPPAPVRLVIADDHPALRAGVRAVLDASDRITVVAEAGGGHEALRLVRLHAPDVLLVDVEMGDLDGIAVAEQLAAARSTTRVLAFSAYDDRAYVARMLQAGAAGYITKDQPLALVAEAVEAVARGEGRWFVSMSPAEPPDIPVSDRELEVLQLMAQGAGNRQIADALGISPNTVRNHVSSIYDKLDVSSWREAIAWAWERGLVRGG